MQLDLVSKKWVLWVACWALAIASLAPAISHALLNNAGSNWVEVCSVGGAKFVHVDAASGQPLPDLPSQHMLEHCPFCALHASGFAPPPVQAIELRLLPLLFELPQLFLLAPITLHAWRTSQPRGPPGWLRLA